MTMWSYSHHRSRHAVDPLPNGHPSCVYLLCKRPTQGTVRFQCGTTCILKTHSQISEAEIWGLRNRFIILPIVVAAVHITILFSGTVVKAVLWGKRVFGPATEVTHRNLPFLQSLLCWSSYSSDMWIDLRNLVIVRMVVAT